MVLERNFGFILVQIINIALIFAWLFLAYKAIRHLYFSSFTISTKLLWGLMIIFIPLLGASLYILTLQELGIFEQQTQKTDKSS